MKLIIAISVMSFSLFSIAGSPCPGDFCPGSRAANNQFQAITITRVSGEKVFYTNSFGQELSSFKSELSPEINSETESILDNNFQVRKVDIAFKDGRISYVSSSGRSIISSEVKREVRELNGFSKEIKVADNSYKTGKVLRVFESGDVQYVNPNGEIRISRDVSPAISALPNGTKSGSTVVDGQMRVLKVIDVFRDGRVEVQDSGASRLLRDVSPEVDLHPDFVKNKEYGANADIGEVLRFFADGRIQVQAETSTFFCNELYEETQDADGIHKDIEVILPAGEGKVEKVFENRMSRIQLGNSATANAIVVVNEELEKREVRSAWLFAILAKVRNESPLRVRFAVQKKDYPRMLNLLKASLNGPSSGFYEPEKSAINSYLDSEISRLSSGSF